MTGLRTSDYVKTFGTVVATIGVGAIIGNITKMTTPVNTNPAMKICITVGGVMLSAIAGKAVEHYVVDTIDELENMMATCSQIRTNTMVI